VKTIERAHSPAHMWERIKLSNSYSKVLEQVSLIPHSFASHSVYSLDRQRASTLAKFYNSQMQATGHENHPVSHKDASAEDAPTVSANFPCIFSHPEVVRPKLIGIKKKLDRREAVRERKALSAAQLERSIEKELIERLKSKAYGDGPLNVNETVWQAILDRERNGSVVGQREDEDLDLVADETDEEVIENEMEDEWDDREFVSDISGDDLSDLEGPLVRI
jgi:protein MAK16